METEDLLKHRSLKFRKIGGFQEGIPIDPQKRVNMKKKDRPIIQPGKTSDLELKNEVEKLKEQILRARESSAKKPDSGLCDMIAKLKREVDYEYSEAAKALGFEEKILMVREEFAKARNSTGQSMNPSLKEKIDKLKEEFHQSLSAAPNYSSLKYKIDMLQELSRAQSLSGKNGKTAESNLDINRRFKELTERPDIKQKIEALEREIESSGMSDGLKEKILSLRDEIEQEFSAVLKSLGLQVDTPTLTDAKAKVDGFSREINGIMEDVVSSSDLKNRIESLKIEVTKGEKTPHPVSKDKIQALQQQITQSIADALNLSELQDRREKLKLGISEALDSPGGTNGSLKYDNAPYVEPQVKVASN